MANLFVLVDGRLKPMKIDLDFIQMLGENGVPFSIVSQKADKLIQSALNANVKPTRANYSKRGNHCPQFSSPSATKKQGKEELLSYIGQILKAEVE